MASRPARVTGAARAGLLSLRGFASPHVTSSHESPELPIGRTRCRTVQVMR